MNRFDEIVKTKLEAHEAPMSMDMWNSIEKDLDASASPSISVNGSFLGGIAATVVLAGFFISLPDLNNNEAKTSAVVDTPHVSTEVMAEETESSTEVHFQPQEEHIIQFEDVKVALEETQEIKTDNNEETADRSNDESEVEEFVEEDQIVTVPADFNASGIQCPGSEITFSAQKTEGAVTWLFDGVHLQEGAETAYTFEGAGTHEVVMMTSVDGKTVSVKKSVTIWDAPSFEINHSIEKGSDCLTSTVNLSADPTGYTYEWSLEGQQGDGIDMSYSLLAGTYMVSLKGISVDGCVGIVTHPIIVRDESGIYIPNSFAPDGDGLNDVWKPVGLMADHVYELSIYTVPEQELVYQSNEVIEWDGSLNGTKLPARKSYLYRLKMTDSCGNSETKSGTLNAVR